MPHDSLSIELLLNRIIKALLASLLLSSTALAADDMALLRCRARGAKRNQARVAQLNAMRRRRPKCSDSKSR
jgi:hypothetical protein